MIKRKEQDFLLKIYFLPIFKSTERIYYLVVDLADWVSVYEAEGVPPEVVLGGEKVQAVLLAATVRLGPVPDLLINHQLIN